MVIHGGVDGYCRIPVYLHASDNNWSDTVFALFLDPVNKYGLPSHVRSDKGGENMEVAWHMLNHPNRGPDRGSMITGDYALEYDYLFKTVICILLQNYIHPKSKNLCICMHQTIIGVTQFLRCSWMQ